MPNQEFYVSYWDEEYLDSQFPERKNTPYFQLAEGEIGLTAGISRPEDFPTIVLDILKYLKNPTSLKNTYQIGFSEDASNQINETEKQVLEEILALHNDFVTQEELNSISKISS